MKPEDCLNIQDIRSEIDNLDRQVIALLGTRSKYVKAAAKFKTSETSVKALHRIATILETRGNWAEQENLNPYVIENIYRDLLDHSIQEEFRKLERE